MSGDSEIRLSVMSDDFGMSPAVNEGIVQAFTKGVLTDTNLMAPCGSFPEAVQLAKAHQIPVGIHATFTAEWDYLRWKPLTPLKSMAKADGTFRETVEGAWENADMGEAEAELKAQWMRIEASGLKITHACEHMGPDPWGRVAGLFAFHLRKEKTPSRNRVHAEKFNFPRTAWTSHFVTSALSTDPKVVREKLKEWIHTIGPGHHLWQCHCAVDHPSLEQMCKPDHLAFHWARTYRMIDQSLVLDPEVREWIEKRGIRLAPISECPTAGF